MPDAFDPYFKWLGIPKADQPPNAYRLLGIELFESDSDVISNAVDGRMAQVKSFQAGKFGAISQKLLNEIAAAKVCLLRPQKKVEYDQRLRAYLQKKESAAVAQVKEAVVVKAVAAPEERGGGLSFLDHAAVPKHAAVRRPARSTKPAWPIPTMFGAGSIALVGGAIAYVLFTDDGKGSSPSLQTAQIDGGRSARSSAATPLEPSPSAGAAGSPSPSGARPYDASTGQNTVPRPTAASPPAEESKSHGKPKIEIAPDLETASPDEGLGKTAPAKKPQDPSTGKKPPFDAAKPAKRPAIPDAATYQAMKAKILDIFHNEYSAAKTADAKAALAAKLDAQGDVSQGDPADRYALWRMAAETACEAGDVSRAIDIANEIQTHFDGDTESIKAELLSAASRAVMTPEAARNFCETATKLALAGIDRDDYDAALRYTKLATSATRRFKDPQFSRELGVRERKIELLKNRYAAVEKAMQILIANADDPAANLVVGNWRCFYKGDWETGLPCLAKCGRPELAALAKRDAAKPADARVRVAIADDWWKLGEKERDYKANYRARAVFWYEQAAPGLTGLEKVRIEKLLEAGAEPSGGEAHNSNSSPKTFGSRGTVQKGNVALASLGATVSGVKTWPEKMINPGATGEVTSFSPTPCEFVITLDKVYQLRQIRFLIQVRTTAMYQLLVSRDDRKFELLQDRTNQQQSDWQKFQFPPRPVKSIKINCTGPGPNLCVDSFEAYCFPIAGDGGQQPRNKRGAQ